MQKVLVVGHATWNTLIQVERFPEPRPQTLFSRAYHEALGGTSAGKALNLRKLGFEVTLFADAAGRSVREAIEREGIHFRHALYPRGTERHVNLMDAEGSRISIYIYATLWSSPPGSR